MNTNMNHTAVAVAANDFSNKVNNEFISNLFGLKMVISADTNCVDIVYLEFATDLLWMEDTYNFQFKSNLLQTCIKRV